MADIILASTLAVDISNSKSFFNRRPYNLEPLYERIIFVAQLEIWLLKGDEMWKNYRIYKGPLLLHKFSKSIPN